MTKQNNQEIYFSVIESEYKKELKKNNDKNCKAKQKSLDVFNSTTKRIK